MDTGTVTAIVVAAVLVLAVVAYLLARRAGEARNERLRAEAYEHRRIAAVGDVEAQRREAEAAEQQARARRQQIAAEEARLEAEAARAEADRAYAKADDLDPDVDRDVDRGADADLASEPEDVRGQADTPTRQPPT